MVLQRTSIAGSRLGPSHPLPVAKRRKIKDAEPKPRAPPKPTKKPTKPKLKSPFRFLDLPAEIRNMIYKYLLDHGSKEIQISRRKRNHVWMAKRVSLHKAPEQHRLTYNLLSVCKQINSEAAGYLYGNGFTLENARVVRMFSTQIGANVKFLRTVRLPNFTHHEWSLGTSLAYAPNLKALHLCLSWRQRHDGIWIWRIRDDEKDVRYPSVIDDIGSRLLDWIRAVRIVQDDEDAPFKLLANPFLERTAYENSRYPADVFSEEEYRAVAEGKFEVFILMLKAWVTGRSIAVDMQERRWNGNNKIGWTYSHNDDKYQSYILSEERYSGQRTGAENGEARIHNVRI